MPLPRFRIRTLMVAVALTALALSLPSLVRQHLRSKEKARVHARQAEHSRFVRGALSEDVQDCLRRAEEERRMEERCMGDPEQRRRVMQALDEYDEARALRNRCGADADYHTRMKRKYELAAWMPWLSVAPDPPDPEDHSSKALPVFGPTAIR